MFNVSDRTNRESLSIVRGTYVIVGVDDTGALEMFRDGAVAYRDGIVEAIGSYEDVKGIGSENVSVFGSEQSVVFPGFVNSHHHVGLTPLQLGSPDTDLEPWIIHRIGARQLSPYLDTLYSAFEMIESGVTTVQHIDGMMFASERQWKERPREVLRAYRDIGMRVSYSVGMFDQNRFVYESDARFIEGLNPRVKELVVRQFGAQPIPFERQMEMGFSDVRDEWEGAGNDRIRVQLAPLGLQWCSDSLLRVMADIAQDQSVGLHMHLLESLAQRSYGARRCPNGVLRHLSGLAMLEPQLTLGHGVWLSEDDIDLMAETGTSLCYNPSSNLRLKSGIAPVLPANNAGVITAIGIDEAGINDDRDMLQELRLAMTLQRLPMSESLSANEAFRMATQNGAITTRFGSKIGALRVGCAADYVVLDWETVCRPYLDPQAPFMDALIRRSRASAVQMVVVDGEVIYHDGIFLGVERSEVFDQLAEQLASPLSSEDEIRREIATGLLGPVVDYHERTMERPSSEPFYTYNSRSWARNERYVK